MKHPSPWSASRGCDPGRRQTRSAQQRCFESTTFHPATSPALPYRPPPPLHLLLFFVLRLRLPAVLPLQEGADVGGAGGGGGAGDLLPLGPGGTWILVGREGGRGERGSGVWFVRACEPVCRYGFGVAPARGRAEKSIDPFQFFVPFFHVRGKRTVRLFCFLSQSRFNGSGGVAVPGRSAREGAIPVGIGIC